MKYIYARPGFVGETSPTLFPHVRLVNPTDSGVYCIIKKTIVTVGLIPENNGIRTPYLTSFQIGANANASLSGNQNFDQPRGCLTHGTYDTDPFRKCQVKYQLSAPEDIGQWYNIVLPSGQPFEVTTEFAIVPGSSFQVRGNNGQPLWCNFEWEEVTYPLV